jgi:hypothetical protein
VTVKELNGNLNPVTQYVTDNKLIMPESLRPSDNLPHVYSWRVTTVRQNSTNSAGEAQYTSAGEVSTEWVFVWMLTGNSTPNP